MTSLRFEIIEPVTVASGAVASNEIRTRLAIPSTTLRGAFYGELRALGRPDLKDLADAWFGAAGPRWSTAWPDGCVPMPLCFLGAKRSGEGEARYFNCLAAEKIPDEFTARVKHPFLKLGENQMPAGFQSALTRTDMHNRIDPATGAVQGNSLFSRETLLEKQVFWSLVDREPSERDLVEKLVLGRRKSTGGDARILGWDTFSFAESPLPNHPGDAAVQLLTDAIVPNAAGSFLRGLTEGDWRGMTGVADVAVAGCRSAAGSVSGWASGWRLPRGSFITIRAGSVWRLRSGDTEGLMRALGRLRDEGIGIRRHEGFGWICVNPPWLTQTLGGSRPVPGKAGSGATREVPPLPWPGFEADDRDGLREVLSKAHAAANGLGNNSMYGAPVRDLLGIIQRTGKTDRATKFLAQRVAAKSAGGERETSWSKLQAQIQPFLQTASTPRHAAFFLQSILTSIGESE